MKNVDRSGLRLAIIGPMVVIGGACLFLSGLNVGMKWGEEKAVAELQPQIDYNAAEMSVLNDRIIGLQESLTFEVLASFYGPHEAGKITANNELFYPEGFTAASKILPFNSRWKVTNTENGKSVIVRINDDGPNVNGRGIDLSLGAARKIDMIKSGIVRVKIEPAL